MKKAVFAGCSLTAGTGWNSVDLLADCKTHQDLYVNLCCTNIDQLSSLETINVAVSGASNTDIFEQAITAISTHGSDINILFCQWSAMPRYQFQAGFEFWDTTLSLNYFSEAPRRTADLNLSRGDSWSKEYLNDLLDRFLVLHHLHGEILKVVRYSSTLQKLSKWHNIRVCFINGICPWDLDYFTRLTSNDIMPENLTEFTKKQIINIDSRDDTDIFKLYHKLHDEYDAAGGIDSTKWVNLYHSMQQARTDTNFDKIHPGTKSHQHYFQQIKAFLEN